MPLSTKAPLGPEPLWKPHPRSQVARLPVYLDHHSTTPVDPRVAKAVIAAIMETFGNPHATENAYGTAASELLELARKKVADLVLADRSWVSFTSGSTEAIRLAVEHACRQATDKPFRIALTRLEHRAVLDAVQHAALEHGAEITWLPVDGAGRLDRAFLTAALRRGVHLVCVMAANNEIGTVYPVQAIAAEARQHGAAMLVDATQAAGLREFRLNESEIDYFVISSHKLYGPKGAGALISTASPVSWSSILWARPGTPNLPGIVGLGEACRLAANERAEDARRIASLRDWLQSLLVAGIPGLVVNGATEDRLENNLHIALPDAPNDAVIARTQAIVAVSTGSACASGSHQPSHVLQAIGLSADLQDGALRLGLGRFTTLPEIDHAAAAIISAVADVRSSMTRQ